MCENIRFITKQDGARKRYFVLLPNSPSPKELIETTETIFWLLKSFQREDWRQERAARRHVEHLSQSINEIMRQEYFYNPSPEELLYKSYLSDEMRRAFMEIPLVQARRFLLHHGLDLSYREIAKTEGCSERAVKRSVYLAKLKLRKKL